MVGVRSAWWVTSRPIIVTSRLDLKTRSAASGSAQMLNSAAGVMFPSAIEPPISTIRSMFSPPMRSRRSAMFVSGPVGMRVTGSGLAASFSIIRSTACSVTGSCCGGGRNGPSSPLSPWTWSATFGSRVRGRSAPAATGMSARPARSSTRSAFAVVFASVWFPWTVVTASSSTSGLARASSSAIASS